MFLANLTILDHAYINDQGIIVGGSFNPDFIVGGDVDPIEQVVVDFSTVKKDLKGIIDEKEDGFDHKLWFMEGYSEGSYEEYANGTRIRITTKATFLDVPRNAVKIFKCAEYEVSAIGEVLGKEVEQKMRKLYPTVRVTCINNTVAHIPSVSIFVDGEDNDNVDLVSKSLFTYSHGLKDSTSWGCNNIAHGHLSYISIYPGNSATLALQDSIAQTLDGVVFINKVNVTEHTEDSITVDYTTSRGRFLARYKLPVNYVIVLETETTIEHLVDYIKNRFKEELDDVGMKFMLVSEGLSKGALTTM